MPKPSRKCILIVYTHHVYKTCTLFSVDYSRGCTTSSEFYFHGFSKGLGYSRLAVSQSHHKSTLTRSSFLLCVASPRQHFGEHRNIMFSFYMHHWPLQGPFFGATSSRNFSNNHSVQQACILHVYPWSLLWHHSGKWCCDARAVVDVTESCVLTSFC